MWNPYTVGKNVTYLSFQQDITTKNVALKSMMKLLFIVLIYVEWPNK